MNIGATIVNLRREKGVTQEQLARAVGVSKPAVSKWETGQSCPDIQLLAPIARYFGVTIDALLSFTRTLSREEADRLAKEVPGIFEQEGFQAGMERCASLVREYPDSQYLKAGHHLRPAFPGGGADGGESCTFPGVRPGAAGGNSIRRRKQILGAGQGDCGLLLYAERELRPRGSLSAGAPRPGDRPGQPASSALPLPRGLGTGCGCQPQGDPTVRQHGTTGCGHSSAVCLGTGGCGYGAVRLRGQCRVGGNAGLSDRNRLALQAFAGYEGNG